MTIKTVETENKGLKRAYTLTIPAKDIDARVEGEVKRIAPTVRMQSFSKSILLLRSACRASSRC